MRKRLSRLLEFVLWLFSPPVPAVEVGGALIAAAWCLGIWLDPSLLNLPSYRSLGLLPRETLIPLFAILAAAHVVSLRIRRLRTLTCLLAGFAWIAASAGFAAANAWPSMITYTVLGAGSFLAALYSEITRRV